MLDVYYSTSEEASFTIMFLCFYSTYSLFFIFIFILFQSSFLLKKNSFHLPLKMKVFNAKIYQSFTPISYELTILGELSV